MNNLAGLSRLPDQQSGPNCGVTAVAILCDSTFEQVFAIMGMDRTKRWKGTTYQEERSRAIRILGFEEHVAVPSPPITLWQFVAHIAKPGVKYMVITRGHAQIVKDGLVQDQNGIYPVARTLQRGRQVLQIVHVTKKSTPDKGALTAFLSTF